MANVSTNNVCYTSKIVDGTTRQRVEVEAPVGFSFGDPWKRITKTHTEVRNDVGQLTSDTEVTTSALQVKGVGCFVRVTTVHNNQVTETMDFAPGVQLDSLVGGRVLSRFS